MRNRLRIFTAAAILLFVTVVGQGLLPSSASACGTGGSDAKNQILGGIGGTANECESGKVGTVLGAVVTILSYVLGIVAIIMIVISGFKYITSGGDAQKAGSAKNTLVYALIGVLVAALAQFLVHFVINQAA